MRHIVFIHIPKTGGNSIAKAFERALAGRQDVVFHHIGHQNISYYLTQEAKRDPYPLDPETLFFTVGRDPYDRFMSGFYHNAREEGSAESKMSVNALARDLRNHYTLLYWRQSWFVEGRERLNFRVFKLEQLEDLCAFFRAEYELDLVIPRLNAHAHPGGRFSTIMRAWLFTSGLRRTFSYSATTGTRDPRLL